VASSWTCGVRQALYPAAWPVNRAKLCWTRPTLFVTGVCWNAPRNSRMNLAVQGKQRRRPPANAAGAGPCIHTPFMAGFVACSESVFQTGGRTLSGRGTSIANPSVNSCTGVHLFRSRVLGQVQKCHAAACELPPGSIGMVRCLCFPTGADRSAPLVWMHVPPSAWARLTTCAPWQAPTAELATARPPLSLCPIVITLPLSPTISTNNSGRHHHRR
jgi:hypothetical protein